MPCRCKLSPNHRIFDDDEFEVLGEARTRDVPRVLKNSQEGFVWDYSRFEPVDIPPLPQELTKSQRNSGLASTVRAQFLTHLLRWGILRPSNLVNSSSQGNRVNREGRSYV